jgi:GntR family transcriptional repressor for pyruvate dehydrogenase complex
MISSSEGPFFATGRTVVSLLHLIEVRPWKARLPPWRLSGPTLAQLRSLEEAIQQQVAAETLAGQIEADVRFHNVLAEAAANPAFQLLLATLAGLLRRSREETLSRTGKQRAAAGHRAILAAIQRQDAQQARAAMLEHLAMAEQDLGGLLQGTDQS